MGTSLYNVHVHQYNHLTLRVVSQLQGQIQPNTHDAVFLMSKQKKIQVFMSKIVGYLMFF